MKLSKHFTLAEMTVTSTGLPNDPTSQAVVELRRLCRTVLEPLRAALGRPLKITSGYRTDEVNRAVGGSSTSQHRALPGKGSAADVVPIGVDRLALWGVVLALLQKTGGVPIDQAIIYETTGHVHVSTSPSPRRQALVKTKTQGYVPWEAYKGSIL